jgi:hypothetical protein
VTGLSDELFTFIGSSFRSVWALELLLQVKKDRRAWSRDELISTLRASELVVNKAVDELIAAGVLSFEGDGIAYMPASDDIARCVKQVEKVYSARPDAVRRAIVSASASGATAFADAFRLRKD